MDRSFFDRGPEIVAQELLGCLIACRRIDCDRSAAATCTSTGDGWVGGLIVETEAYLGRNTDETHPDLASHSARPRSRSNQSMFGPPGHLYVYPIHAKFCMNLVTQSEGIGSAILIRAIEPLWGDSVMTRRRGSVDPRHWTSGPAKACQAMDVDRRDDGTDLFADDRGRLSHLSHTVCDSRPDREWKIEKRIQVRKPEIVRTPRIGIRLASELKLRFFVDGNRFVSGKAGDHTRPRQYSLCRAG